MRLYGPSSVSVPGGGVEPFLPRMTKTRLIRVTVVSTVTRLIRLLWIPQCRG